MWNCFTDGINTEVLCLFVFKPKQMRIHEKWVFLWLRCTLTSWYIDLQSQSSCVFVFLSGVVIRQNWLCWSAHWSDPCRYIGVCPLLCVYCLCVKQVLLWSVYHLVYQCLPCITCTVYLSQVCPCLPCITCTVCISARCVSVCCVSPSLCVPQPGVPVFAVYHLRCVYLSQGCLCLLCITRTVCISGRCIYVCCVSPALCTSQPGVSVSAVYHQRCVYLSQVCLCLPCVTCTVCILARCICVYHVAPALCVSQPGVSVSAVYHLHCISARCVCVCSKARAKIMWLFFHKQNRATLASMW